MTPIRLLLLCSGCLCIGVVLAVTGWAQPRPNLMQAWRDVSRVSATGSLGRGPVRAHEMLTTRVIEPLTRRSPILLDDEDLRLIGRSPQQQITLMILASLVGLLIPMLALTAAQILGLVSLAVYVPGVIGLISAVGAPMILHRSSAALATRIRDDLRYQLSAFLDVVTMLLAGNTGHEGALIRAAQAGDGRLFLELSRSMRESAAAGRSLVASLEQIGVELGLVELRQVASTVSLSSAEGSPVARTLAAKCSTLRSTLASEQETQARLRTSRLTTPLVGMGLIFMALVIYPALGM